MKKQFITVALFTVLCSMSVGCQKDDIVESQMGLTGSWCLHYDYLCR